MLRLLKALTARFRYSHARKLQAIREARAEAIAKIASGHFPQVSAHELRALTTLQLRLESGR